MMMHSPVAPCAESIVLISPSGSTLGIYSATRSRISITAPSFCCFVTWISFARPVKSLSFITLMSRRRISFAKSIKNSVLASEITTMKQLYGRKTTP